MVRVRCFRHILRICRIQNSPGPISCEKCLGISKDTTIFFLFLLMPENVAEIHHLGGQISEPACCFCFLPAVPAVEFCSFLFHIGI